MSRPSPSAAWPTHSKRRRRTPPGAEPAAVAPAPVGGSAGEAGEIVVTAQRRAQKLSDVGLSITAIGSEVLTERNVTRAEDLSQLVPGLSVSDSGFSTPIYTLRGVGVNEPSIGSSSSVAVYVDEVPLAYPVMTQGATLDLQRVEVLKGPQGTLYGQNATGGAINYIANKPTDDFQAGVLGTFGRFNRGLVEGYVSGPLGPTLKARIAAQGELGDDWQRSISRDAGLGKIRRFTGRGIVDWAPAPAVHLALTVDGWIDQSDTISPQLVAVLPGNAFNVDRNLVVLDPTNPASCSTPVGRLPGCPINAATGTRVTAANQPVVVRPSLLAGDNARLTDFDAGQDFSRDDAFYQAALRGDITLSDRVSLTSITSYAHLDRRQNSEFDGTAVSENLRNYQTGEIKSFAQEVRLNADFSGIHFIAGANYGHDTTSDNVLQFLRNASAVQNIVGFPSDGGGIRANQSVTNYAAFTDIDIPIARALTFSAGARISNDRRHFVGCGYLLDSFSSPAYTGLINAFRGRAGLAPIAAAGAGPMLFGLHHAGSAGQGRGRSAPVDARRRHTDANRDERAVEREPELQADGSVADLRAGQPRLSRPATSRHSTRPT